MDVSHLADAIISLFKPCRRGISGIIPLLAACVPTVPSRLVQYSMNSIFVQFVIMCYLYSAGTDDVGKALRMLPANEARNVGMDLLADFVVFADMLARREFGLTVNQGTFLLT